MERQLTRQDIERAKRIVNLVDSNRNLRMEKGEINAYIKKMGPQGLREIEYAWDVFEKLGTAKKMPGSVAIRIKWQHTKDWLRNGLEAIGDNLGRTVIYPIRDIADRVTGKKPAIGEERVMRMRKAFGEL